MSYAKLKPNGSFDYEITEVGNILWDSKNFCTAKALIADGKGPAFHVVELYETDPPVVDTNFQRVIRDGGVYNNGRWEYNWRIDALSAQEIEDIQNAKAAANSQRLHDKVEALWAAADRYVTGYISGVAIGILTIGVIQNKPKALAVTGWSSAVWAEYYRRKALVTPVSTDDLDFSSFGAMPYTVPELQEEIGL